VRLPKRAPDVLLVDERLDQGDPAGTAACCQPLSSEPLSAEQAGQVAPLLKELADPVRLRLMSLIASHRGGEAWVCDLTEAFDLSQPTISHHVKCCTTADCRTGDKRGVWVYYRARAEALASLGMLIGDRALARRIRHEGAAVSRPCGCRRGQANVAIQAADRGPRALKGVVEKSGCPLLP
jgi:ArsR family transcriptional regulator